MNVAQIKAIGKVFDKHAIPMEDMMTCRVQAGATREQEPAWVFVPPWPELPDWQDVLGALALYHAHEWLDLEPLIATVFGPDTMPIVTMVGWAQDVAGEEVAILSRIVGNPSSPPGLGHFALVDRRWGQVVLAHGLLRTITCIEPDRPEIAALAKRYRFTCYAHAGAWDWYVREE